MGVLLQNVLDALLSLKQIMTTEDNTDKIEVGLNMNRITEEETSEET